MSGRAGRERQACRSLRYSLKKILLVFALFMLWVIVSTVAMLYVFDYYAVTQVIQTGRGVPSLIPLSYCALLAVVSFLFRADSAGVRVNQNACKRCCNKGLWLGI